MTGQRERRGRSRSLVLSGYSKRKLQLCIKTEAVIADNNGSRLKLKN